MSGTRSSEPVIDRYGRDTFINLFLTANQFYEQVEAVCRTEGLTMSHYTVLWIACLSDEPEGVPMKVVADGVLTRAADATRLVDRLKKDGYVERVASPEDRRKVLIRATAEGEAVFVRITKSVKALHREQWASLSVAELKELHRLLVKALWGQSSSVNRHPLEELPPNQLGTARSRK